MCPEKITLPADRYEPESMLQFRLYPVKYIQANDIMMETATNIVRWPILVCSVQSIVLCMVVCECMAVLFFYGKAKTVGENSGHDK